MKKICGVMVLLIMIGLCGCGEGENTPLAECSTPKPESYVVHVATSAPEATSVPEPVSSVVDWDEVISVTTACLPDMEALNTLLPEPVTVLDYDYGDIDFDGNEDVVIVYEYPETEGEDILYRTLALYTGEDTYQCLACHETLLLDLEAGGTMADPYQYAEIADNGELHISFCGGANWRWGHDLWFELLNDVLVMHRLVDTYSYALTGDEISLIYDFREQHTSCDAYWYMEDLNYGLMYEYEWPEMVESFILTDIYDIGDLRAEVLPSMDVPLPIYDVFYANEDMRSRFADFSAENVLDAVKEANYPEMEKVMYDTDILNLEDISAFMGYEMPRYYYEDDRGVKLYYRTASFDADTGWTHEVCLTGEGVHETLFHRE